MNPIASLRQRVQRWFEQRVPRQDSQTLTQRNIYILPTRAGWAFCATLAVMLLASINYQLNLGYALTFLLGGAALVSMHQTHANLRRLTLQLKAPQPVFAGEPATIEVVLASPGHARCGIGLRVASAARDGTAFVDVPDHGQASARLRFVAPGRGRHRLPTLVADTHFPLGLFRAWTVWRPAALVLVYPAPEAPPSRCRHRPQRTTASVQGASARATSSTACARGGAATRCARSRGRNRRAAANSSAATPAPAAHTRCGSTSRSRARSMPSRGCAG